MKYYIASFPKCGNTWARFIVANLLYDNTEINFLNIHDIVPEDVVNVTNLTSTGLKAYKTHSKYLPIFEKVIYIMRDPFDAMYSYHQYINFEKNERLTIDQVVRHKDYGIIALREHVESYVYGCHDMLLLSYEKLSSDICKCISQIADYMSITIDEITLNSIATKCSFQYMRNLEIAKGRKHYNPNFTFMRKGNIGEGRCVIGQDTALTQFIDSEIAKSALLRYLYG